MSQRLSLPISKHILNLYDEDWLFLMKRFGPDGHHNVGVAHVIRECVHKLVLRTRQAEADLQDQRNSTNPVPDYELDRTAYAGADNILHPSEKIDE